MRKFEEKTLSSENIYNGKVFDVKRDEIELSTGHKSVREIINHTGGVVIVAIKDDNKILLVKQFRYAIQQIALELPAGKLEKGEDPDLAAKRELEEETGFIASKWESLGYIHTTPGFCDEKLYLYLATDLTFTKQNPDEGEIIECFEYNSDEVFEMIKTGVINDAKTICALMRANLTELK